VAALAIRMVYNYNPAVDLTLAIRMVFSFRRRKNVVLSIDSDKTDEAELQAAVSGASRGGLRGRRDCCLAVEEALNTVYRQGRHRSTGPLEIRVVCVRRHVRRAHGLPSPVAPPSTSTRRLMIELFN
jgi:hypothetical protein